MGKNNLFVAPIDRRSADRKAVTTRAKVIVGDDHPIDCILSDISDGARIRVASPHSFPDHFDLFLPVDRRIAPVQVVWRSDREIGVALAGPWRPRDESI